MPPTTRAPRKKAVRRSKHQLIVDKLRELSYGDLAKVPVALVDSDRDTAQYILTSLKELLAEEEEEGE